jgi:GntR family transcriptional regulator
MILCIYNIYRKTVVIQLDIVISNASEKPIDEQITDQIKNKILTGILTSGDALPSMRQLARDLHISVITTKRAYDDLERDGFLETVGGKGCFVARKNMEFLREEQLRKAEEYLRGAVNVAYRAGIPLNELQEMLSLLFEDGSEKE